jgi:putative ABC transport system permease protein
MKVPRLFIDLRYSARSFARTPGLTLALLLSIAAGIGSNASVHGFVRGLNQNNSPLTGIDRVVSVFGRDVRREAGPISYEDYLWLKKHGDAFEWIGAARVSQVTITLAGQPVILSAAAVTPELAEALKLSPDKGVVISGRVWRNEFHASTNFHDAQVRIGDVDRRVTGVAPDRLEGLYFGQAVDLWTPLQEAPPQGADPSIRNLWVIGRLRPDASNTLLQDAVLTGRSTSGQIVILPYTGFTPGTADGFARAGTLLRAAGGAVFFLACANVIAFLVGRASSRSHETSLRVALGASHRQLARQMLSDSVFISVTGGALGTLLAVWTSRIIPALLFEQDAEQLVLAPDLFGVAAASAGCIAITIVCGLMPLIAISHARPAEVLSRESSGPSKGIVRLRAGLVIAQMACCCVLVICTGFLLEGLRGALRTSAGQHLGQPVLASVQADPNVGMKYFENIEHAAEAVPALTGRAWAGVLPGSQPTWQSFRIEPRQLPLREVTMDIAGFTGDLLDLFTLPPSAGRMFSSGDQSCRVAIVNEEAAAMLFDGETAGRTVQDPSGLPVEIIGVVAVRRTSHTRKHNPPTIYYYSNQAGTQLGGVAAARFLAPTAAKLDRADLAANVVSSSYFQAMGLSLVEGHIFPEGTLKRGCRSGVINQEAADLYFAGNPIGAAVIDDTGRRTEITGVVRSAPLGSFRRREEPTIYFPMAQDCLPRMTVILGAREASDALLAEVRRRFEAVPGRGPAPIVVKTLDTHLSNTALAPLRIVTSIAGVSTITALILGIAGLCGTLNDAARQRGRELAVRIALGAQRRHVIRQVLREGGRLAGAGALAGMLGSLLLSRLLSRIAPAYGSPAVWIWLTGPLVLATVVAIASVLPARRGSMVNPLTIMRNN